MAVLSIGQVWADEVTITPAQALNEGGVSPITIACAKGDGTSNPAISSGELRLYQAGSGKTTGNTITFSSTYPITKIVFDFTSGKTASNGSFSVGSYDDATMTWTGSATSLTLTVTGTTSGTRIYIKGMTVTYDAGSVTPDPDPTPGEDPEPTDDADVVLDFSQNWGLPISSGTKKVAEESFTDGTHTIKVAGTTGNGYYISSSTYLLLGKNGAYVILPEFSSPIETIVCEAGASSASTGVKWNVFDGNTAVSTEVTGCTTDNTFEIENPTANKAYKIKVGSNHNLQIAKIKIYFEPASSKEAAGLAFETAAYLVKANGSLATPTLSTAEGFDGTVTYASSDANVVAVNATTGALTIKAAGKAEITASSLETENFKAGSAKYTIYVAEQAGTAEDPLTEASAKTLIDLGCGMDVYMVGTVATKNYYTTSKTYTVDLTGGMQYYYFYEAAGETVFETDYLKVGDIITAYGTLKKVSDKYRLNPSYMVNRVEYTEPLNDISNTKETAYSVATALTKATDPTSDLDNSHVFISGVVYSVKNFDSENGTLDIYIKDAGVDNKFEFFKCKGINDGSATTPFASADDVQVGNVVIGYGMLKYYSGGSIWEFDNTKDGDYLVELQAPVTGVELNATAEVEEGSTVNLTATILPSNATGTIVWSVESGSDKASVDAGVVTGIKEGEATIRATVQGTAFYAECTVTVNAGAPVLTDYYEKVTETAGITDGTYLIVYEAGGLAFNGGLETLDAESNTIPVAITNDNKIGVTEATAAATFFIDVTAGSILAANGEYIGVSSYGNGLKTSETSDYTNAFAIDGEGNAVISIYNATWNKGSEGTMILRYNSASGQTRFRYYKEGGQQPIALYKLANEVVKANPELAWSAESVEITLGETFTAPTLDNPHSVEGITFASDNEALATVTDAGVIELVADATGMAHITASFAGNDDYKAVNVSCTITVNAVPTPAETKNVVIIAEYNSKFYAMTNSLTSGALAGVEVEKDGSKIVVSSAEDKAVIQWTATVDGDNTTLKDAENNYIKGSSGASLSLDAAPYNWNWDGEKSCYISSAYTTRGLFFSSTGNVFKGYALSNITSDGYAATEVIEIDPEDIVISSKVDPELAYDPEELEIEAADIASWSAPVLGYATGFDGLAAIEYGSNNESVATVTEGGEISLAGGYGTAVITATFGGNTNYIAGSATYTITVNAPAPTPTGTTYTKVTSTGEITDGEYLIVYETTSVAFNGALETLDAEGNSVAVVINEGVIAGTTAIDAAVFTIDVTAGTLQSASGKYIGVSSNSNGLKQTEDASTYTHTFSIDGEGNAVILANFEESTMKLRYNPSTSAGNLRFRYYKNDGQQAIQLYKKETPEPPVVDYTEVRNGLTEGWYYTMCLDKAVTAGQGGSIWRVLSKAENGTDVILEEVIGTLEAGRPYIFYATADILEVVYAGSAVIEPVDDEANHGLKGSFSQQPIAQSPNNYIIYNNALYYVNSNNVYVGAHRAYLDMTGVPAYSNEPQQGAPRRRVVMAVNGQNGATGFENINATEKPMKLMIDGKIYILRGEKMFDATGRLVK